jgi:DNA mismatch repair protein MSH5
MVVCTTHFLELFSMDVIHDRHDGIRARQMALHIPQGNDDRATPLFKLIDGVASSSAGLICAQNAGLHPAIIDRAKEIIQTIRERKTIEPQKDALPRDSVPSQSEVPMLQTFLSVPDWANATDDLIRDLLRKIAHVDDSE